MSVTPPPELLLRALSIRQPYVEAIFRGTKTAEFRRRPTNIRGRVYLYASLQPADEEYGQQVGIYQLGIPYQEWASLPRGGILGSAELTGCEWAKRERAYAWKLANPRRYERIFHAIGQPQPVFWHPKWQARV